MSGVKGKSGPARGNRNASKADKLDGTLTIRVRKADRKRWERTSKFYAPEITSLGQWVNQVLNEKAGK